MRRRAQSAPSSQGRRMYGSSLSPPSPLPLHHEHRSRHKPQLHPAGLQRRREWQDKHGLVSGRGREGKISASVGVCVDGDASTLFRSSSFWPRHLAFPWPFPWPSRAKGSSVGVSRARSRLEREKMWKYRNIPVFFPLPTSSLSSEAQRTKN